MSHYVGESRGELLAWLNDLLPNPIRKIEECGKGDVYCMVLDSIYGDLPMGRVKTNARMEYEYLENFKILQKAFAKHKIDKPIPVTQLVKCKMQDNLEFMQWFKKFWDANSRGERYSGAAVKVDPTPSGSRGVSGTGARARPSAGIRSSAGHAPAPRTVSAASQAQLQALNAQVQEMQATCEGLEKERDFYFAKLRSIELIVADRMSPENPDAAHVDEGERETLEKVQEVLYQTEEGFEVPEDGLEDPLDDEETF